MSFPLPGDTFIRRYDSPTPATGCMESVLVESAATPVEAAGVLTFFNWTNAAPSSSVFAVPHYC